jgi:WhiB family redox-sensing transcriptional regulator
MENISLDLYPDFHEKGPARCSSPHIDPDMFFTEPKEPGYREDVHKAKAVCGPCVYKDECLIWALEKNEIGVWGGTTEHERRRLKRKALSSKLNTYDNLYSL